MSGFVALVVAAGSCQLCVTPLKATFCCMPAMFVVSRTQWLARIVGLRAIKKGDEVVSGEIGYVGAGLGWRILVNKYMSGDKSEESACTTSQATIRSRHVHYFYLNFH